MAALIDSSVFIDIERRRLGLEDFLTAHAGEEVALAAITASELLHGVHRATKAKHRALREAFVESVLANVAIIPFDPVTARIQARLWPQLAAKGMTVEAHDLLIAATALAIGFTVATRDERSFPHIPGLSVVRW